MTSRERICAAMNLETPDRTPVMCQLSMGHYFVQLGLDPAEYWLDNEVIAGAYVELARRYRFDGVLVNLPGRSPDARKWVDHIEDKPGKRVIHYKDGSRCDCPLNDLPVHIEGRRPPLEDLDPEQIYYEDPHTLGGLKYPFHYDMEPESRDVSHFPPTAGAPAPAESRIRPYFPESVFALIDLVVAEVGEELSVHGEVFSPFTQLMERLGYQDGLMALLEEPEKCKAVLARFAQGAADLATLQAARGVDAVLISSAFAGAGFISKGMYEEFVLPYERVVAEAIKAAGVKAYTHTCGAIGDRLELMEATGINGIDTMDPPPLGDTDLADAKARVGGRLFLKGNIDSVSVLLRGSAEDVRRNAQEKLEAASAGGGYILSSACSVAPKVPAENLMVLREVAAAFAQTG